MPDFLDDAKNVAANLWRKSREGVDNLAAAIDQRAGATKLGGSMRNLNREREELVTEMGKKVYALYRRGKVENLDLLAACKRIDEIAAEIEAAREALEKLRDEAKPELEVPEVTDDTPPTVEPAPEPAREPEAPVCVEPVVAAEAPAPEALPEPVDEPGEGLPAESPEAGDDAPAGPQETI